MEVNIYINIHYTGHLSKGQGTYGIILEYITANGEPVTKEIYEGLTVSTKNRTALKACIVALSHLTKKCLVRLYINNAYVANTIIQGWHFKWDYDTWSHKGKPIKNADLWKQLFDLLATHKTTFELSEINQYTTYMETMLKRIDILYKEDKPIENNMQPR